MRCAAGIRLRWRPAPRRRGAAAGPFAADEVPVGPRRRRSAASLASARTSAAECAQPGLPVQALTSSHGEFSSNTRPSGASTRSAAVGDALVEVADQHRAPRRDHHRGVDRGEVFGRPRLQHAQRHRGAQRDAAVVLGDPAHRRPGDGWPRRPGLRVSGEVVNQNRGIGEFRYPPSVFPYFDEASCDRRPASGRRRPSRPEHRCRGRPAARRPIVEHVRADVGAQAGDVAAAVVDAEPEPAGQLGQRGLGPDRGVQLDPPTAARRRRPPTRPDSGDATMLRTRSWVGDGSRPAAATASATAAGVGDAADLDVAARGQLQRASRTGRPPGPAPRAGPVDHPAGQRTRASAPSAAWCTCSAPGQASWSRVRAMSSRYVGATHWGSALRVRQYPAVSSFLPMTSPRHSSTGHKWRLEYPK